MRYWEQSDEELLHECDWYAGRASGPGGQKRNKTHSAINMIHKPTKITAIANEHRMQGENRALALKRMRMQLMLSFREEIDVADFVLPEFITQQTDGKGKLRVNESNKLYLSILALMLDLMHTFRGEVAPAAKLLNISTTNFINLLAQNEKVWTAANRMRTLFGLHALKK